MTITDYSDQLTQVLAVGHAPLKPNEELGRVRFSRFTFNTGAAAQAVGQSVALCRIPKGARIIGGKTTNEAMGAGATVKFGLMAVDGSGYINVAKTIADDDDLLGSAIDIAAAGEDTFADTAAFNYGYELEKECYLVATVAGAEWALDKDLNGHILYVID